MTSGVDWQVPPEQALPELGQAYASAIHKGVLAIGNRWAPQIANWMKQNAPWTDRTSNARQTLWSDVDDVTNVMVEIIFSHGMDYGIFLELNNAGRFAIINPALDHFAPLIWADVQRMLS